MKTDIQSTGLPAAYPALDAEKAFREYLRVHAISEHIKGHDADDMALELARIALDFQPAAPVSAEPVAYLDLGAGGYMDVGTDLTDEQLAALPKGRHMLAIVGTYGVEGFAAAPVAAQAQPEGMPGSVGEAMESARWRNALVGLCDTDRIDTPEQAVANVKRRMGRIGAPVAAPIVVQAQPYKDSTPDLHVGDSSFESWYSDYLVNAPVHQDAKQKARDAYAAGMGDPLVVARAQQPVSGADGLVVSVHDALEWYAQHVGNCRRFGPVGDAARADLDGDGGRRARAALAQQDADKASTQAVEYDIEAAAKTIAKRMYCSWEHMPEKARSEMRLHARAVIDAARKEVGHGE